MVVGGDGDDLGVGHRDLRVVGRQFQVLLMLFGAVVAARQGKDQRIAALQLAEPAHRAGVIRESVIGEGAAGPDVRTHWMTASRSSLGDGMTIARATPLSPPWKPLARALVAQVP